MIGSTYMKDDSDNIELTKFGNNTIARSVVLSDRNQISVNKQEDEQKVNFSPLVTNAVNNGELYTPTPLGKQKSQNILSPHYGNPDFNMTHKQINLKHRGKGNKNLSIIILEQFNSPSKAISRTIKKSAYLDENINEKKDSKRNISTIHRSNTIEEKLDDGNENIYNNGPYSKTGNNFANVVNNINNSKTPQGKRTIRISQYKPTSQINHNNSNYSKRSKSNSYVADENNNNSNNVIYLDGMADNEQFNNKSEKNSQINFKVIGEIEEKNNQSHDENDPTSERPITRENSNISDNRINNEPIKNPSESGKRMSELLNIKGLNNNNFNFDPNEIRRYKRNDILNAKNYFKYRYIYEKLIEINNLVEPVSPRSKKLTNSNINNFNQNKNNNRDVSYYYSADDKNVIKFTCLFLQKMEKAIFLFNMKKYEESYNYLKESGIILNRRRIRGDINDLSRF